MFNQNVEDTGNNVDLDDRHIEGHADSLYCGYIGTHEDTSTWYDIFSKGTI